MWNYIEIDCKPSQVFEYIAKLEKHSEWQTAILKSKKVPSGATRLGTQNTELRQMPGGAREVTAEIVEYNPPHKIAAKTVSKGPIQATITILVKPLSGGKKSGVTFESELTGIGLGKALVIFARRSNKKQIPCNLARLKERLEAQ